jgi:hypothetical protein
MCINKKNYDEDWRKRAKQTVSAVLRDSAGQEEETIRIALMDAYPFDKLKTFKQFLVWLNEIHRQRKSNRPAKQPTENKNQGELF